MTPFPDFRSSAFLRDHVRSILDFYAPSVFDATGGFVQNFYDDGRPFAPKSKHLVSSCRMIFNYIVAEQCLQDGQYRHLWQHGLSFLREQHKLSERPGYVWTFSEDGSQDETHYSYGLAFVLLAYSQALKAGEHSAKADIYETYDLLEEKFWLPTQSLYGDEYDANWQTLSPYRGQNANMHTCEALICAFEATQDRKFLDRALLVADTICNVQAAKADGLIWEHFQPDLTLNWQFNIEDPKNLYRPWGFQPGHQTEWSKLLVQLYQHEPLPWLLERAKALFDWSWENAWDEQHGGLYYGISPDGSVCDDDKYFWVQAESFAAAALLAQALNDMRYWTIYDQLWSYCWHHFVDHQFGAWFRVLKRNNSRYNNRKSEAGAKCDYHTIGASTLVLTNGGLK